MDLTALAIVLSTLAYPGVVVLAMSRRGGYALLCRALPILLPSAPQKAE